MSKQELIDAVLVWWETHQYDCYVGDAGDGYSEEYNTYDEEPEFVKIAQKLTEEAK